LRDHPKSSSPNTKTHAAVALSGAVSGVAAAVDIVVLLQRRHGSARHASVGTGLHVCTKKSEERRSGATASSLEGKVEAYAAEKQMPLSRQYSSKARALESPKELANLQLYNGQQCLR